jgi:hypothetical protein
VISTPLFSFASVLLLALFAENARAVTLETVLPPGYADSVAQITNYRQSGKATVYGLTGDIEIIYAEPDRFLVSYELGPMKLAQGFDGSVAWTLDQNQQIVTLSGNERKKIINAAFLAGQSYLGIGRMSGECAYLKDTAISSTNYHLFLALPEGGDSLWIYVNQDTRRIEMTAERLDEITMHTFLSDFRDIHGVPFPLRYVTKASLLQMNSDIEFERFDYNLNIDPDIFTPTEESEIDFGFPPDRDSVTLPFQFQGGHIYITVSVNGGADLLFMLDSGAGINILDKKFAERQRLLAEGKFPAKGIGGYDSASVAPIDSISIGDIRLFHQVAAVVDLSELGLQSPGEFGGLIGYDLLSRMPVKVDYDKQRLVLYKPQTFTAPDSQFAVTLSLTSKVPSVDVALDGCSGRFLVDLGSAFGVILHKPFVDRNNLESQFTDIKEVNGRVSGIGGSSRTKSAIGNKLKIGNLELEKPPLLIVEGESGVLKSSEIDGNLGNMMLRQYTPLFDYKNQKLYLLPSL